MVDFKKKAFVCPLTEKDRAYIRTGEIIRKHFHHPFFPVGLIVLLGKNANSKMGELWIRKGWDCTGIPLDEEGIERMEKKREGVVAGYETFNVVVSFSEWGTGIPHKQEEMRRFE